METVVGCGRLVTNDFDQILSFVNPSLALIDSRSVCGIEHLKQAAVLSLSSHNGGFNLSKDKSTEVLLYLTFQRQISKALKLAGIKDDTKSIAWVSFGELPANLSDIVNEDSSVLSISKYNFPELASDIAPNLEDSVKQKIVMTRTATLPVQPR